VCVFDFCWLAVIFFHTETVTLMCVAGVTDVMNYSTGKYYVNPKRVLQPCLKFSGVPVSSEIRNENCGMRRKWKWKCSIKRLRDRLIIIVLYRGARVGVGSIRENIARKRYWG
jgi:hypothetical protein